jgi:hypothetical protein
MSTVCSFDPTKDLRWDRFLYHHPRSSVFHSPGWLEALRRTYGYEPVVYTTAQPGAELENGLLFCQICSRLTGRRIVSLPFSDHCEPLVDKPADLDVLFAALMQSSQTENWRYIEVRPLHPLCGAASLFRATEPYCFHRLDLRPSLDELYRSLQKDSIERKIRRAGREGLVCETGRTETLLAKFYQLMLITRRRHGLPVAPREWFQNLVKYLGDALTIRVASKDGQPVAAILTLCFKSTVLYKYGCSDARFHSLGGMPFLFWKTIEASKKDGATELDLGRSDLDNLGLITFKDRLGATQSTLTYLRFPEGRSKTASASWRIRLAKQIFGYLPDGFLAAAGKLLYPHIG